MTPQEIPQQEDDWVWLARIRHPQGRKGEVFAEILTDFPEKFADRKNLWLLAEITSAQKPRSVTGHDRGTHTESGSRAASAPKAAGALAPEGKPPASPSPKSQPREVELIAHWQHKGGIVLHFQGIDSISAAETLQGQIVAIPKAQRAPLAEDEVYTGDLIGCRLIDVAPPTPVVVGEIEEVDRTAGPVALLVVKSATGEVLIPFAKAFLRKIDLESKRVEMALPEGLVDLNKPEKK